MSNILARAQITLTVVQDGDKGDPGRDAVAYVLQPVREDAVVDRDRRLAVRLEYRVVRNEGGTQTVVDTARHPECVVESGFYTRNLQTGLQQGVPLTFTRGKLSSAAYTLDNYGSPLVVQELFVQLLLNNEVVDRRYIPVVMKPHAVTEIDTALGRISNTVYGSSTSGDYGIVNYITDITQRIDSIDLSVTSMKPGGGNLVVNGDFGDSSLSMFGNMGGITSGIRTDQGAPGFARVLAMDCTAANQGLYLNEGGQEVLYPMKPGLEYVLSFLVKASAPTSIHVGNGQSGIHFHDRKTVAVNTEWKRVEYTFRPRYATTWIKIYSAAPATLYVTAIQVEPGNKATEWDNTQEAVRRTGINIRNRRITLTSDNVEVRNNSGTTTLLVDSRGKLTASLIDVNSLFAQNIDARNGHITNLNVDNGTIGKFTLGAYNIRTEGTDLANRRYAMSLSKQDFYMTMYRPGSGSYVEKNIKADVFAECETLKVQNIAPKRAGLTTGTNAALVAEASGQDVNLSFLGKGNMVVDGMADGFAAVTLQSSVTGNVYDLDLRKANRFRIATLGASGQSVRLPKYSDVWEIVGHYGGLTSITQAFSIRVTVFNRGYGNAIAILGRNVNDSSSSYPLLFDPDGTPVNAYLLGSGKCVDVYLVYFGDDSSQKYAAYIK